MQTCAKSSRLGRRTSLVVESCRLCRSRHSGPASRLPPPPQRDAENSRSPASLESTTWIGLTHCTGLSLDNIGAVRAPDRFCRRSNNDETERSRPARARHSRSIVRICAKTTAAFRRRCNSRLGCQASSPCRRGSQRCPSRGIRSHRSGGPRGFGRCA